MLQCSLGAGVNILLERLPPLHFTGLWEDHDTNVDDDDYAGKDNRIV